jgi:hypothetical protein
MPADATDVTDGRRNGEKTDKPRALSPRVLELIKERDGLLPVWVRAPVTGPEHYTGFTRAKLYELTADRKIRSVSIREPGQVRGVRLFNLASILQFIDQCEQSSETLDTTETLQAAGAVVPKMGDADERH